MPTRLQIQRATVQAVYPVVNVCFHGIGDPDRELELGEARYWVSVSRFHEVLDTVADDPRVRISFDDGNLSDVSHGLPALVERGLGATFFVLAGRLGQPGSLRAADVQALVAAGMTIGSHGMDHRPWRNLEPEARTRELDEARQILREVSGTSVWEAALPLGRYNRSLLAELRRRHYTAIHTSDRRWARADGWLQPRFSVRHDDTAVTIRREVLQAPPVWRSIERRVVTTMKRWR